MSSTRQAQKNFLRPWPVATASQNIQPSRQDKNKEQEQVLYRLPVGFRGPVEDGGALVEVADRGPEGNVLSEAQDLEKNLLC